MNNIQRFRANRADFYIYHFFKRDNKYTYVFSLELH